MYHTYAFVLTFLYTEVLASTSSTCVSLECSLYCRCLDRISRGLGGQMFTLVQIDIYNKFLTVIKHCKTNYFLWTDYSSNNYNFIVVFSICASLLPFASPDTLSTLLSTSCPGAWAPWPVGSFAPWHLLVLPGGTWRRWKGVSSGYLSLWLIPHWLLWTGCILLLMGRNSSLLLSTLEHSICFLNYYYFLYTLPTPL